MSGRYNVAVVGATGLVGETMISILEERDFPVDTLFPLASERSLGKTVRFRGREVPVESLADFDFTRAQVGLFSAGGSVSAAYAPKAADCGCVVIDNTSHFRYDDDIPLVVPEVNPQAIADYRERNIIANPNCSTIQMLVAIKPLHDAAGVTRINVCTYQAVSGAGRSAVESLARQTATLLNGKPLELADGEPRFGFNAVPHIDEFQENGFTKEEMKMLWESQKILGDPTIMVNPTAVRVPVFFGHSEAVHLETRRKIGAEEARQVLSEAPGVIVVDEPRFGGYPTAVQHAAGADGVFVGRIREDFSHEHGLNLWVVSDNVRKGAALNSVQIAEILVKDYF